MENVHGLGVQGVHDEKIILDSITDTIKDTTDVEYWLKQVRMLDELIDAKLVEKEQWLSLGCKITPEMTGMPHAPGVSDKVGNVAAHLADLAFEIDDLVDRFIDQKQAVCDMLERLPPEEYGVLHRHYIQYKTLGRIAAEMNYSYMQIWRFKCSGLERLLTIM